MIKKLIDSIHNFQTYGKANSKKEVKWMYRLERLLDTVFGYTGWHDLTNSTIHREQELEYLYEDDDENGPIS